MSIIDVLAPKHRWCPRLLTGLANDDPITTLTDSGSGLKNFTASTTARPTYIADGVDGHAVARFNGTSNVMAQSAAADFKFLHDGSPFTVVVVCKTNASNPNAQYCLLDNCAGASANVGFFFSLDDRNSVGANNRMSWRLCRGVGGVPTFADGGVNEDIVQQSWTSILLSYDEGSSLGSGYEYHSFIDNSISRTGNSAASPSSASPTSTLRLGCDTSGTFWASIDLAEMLIFDRVLSPAERYDLNRYIAETYPSVLTHAIYPQSLGTIPSLGYDAFPGACERRSANAPIIIAWHSGSTHVAHGDHSVIMHGVSDDGFNVRARRVAISHPTYGMRGSNLTRISDDRLVMTGFAYDIVNVDGVLNGSWWCEATTFGLDGLPEWSAPTYFADGFTKNSYCQDRITVLANGDWITTIYGLHTAGTYTSATLMRRTGGSGAFGSEVMIADGPAVSKQYNECRIVEYSPGNLLAAVRNETDTRIDFVFSTDSGATWGSVVTGISGYGAPGLHRDPDTGRIWMLYRQASTQYQRLTWSDDNGSTWATGVPIDRRNLRMLYGQFVRFGNGETWLVHSWENTSVTSAIINIKKFANGSDANGIGQIVLTESGAGNTAEKQYLRSLAHSILKVTQ